jgi:hypothetical protein
MSDLRRTDRAVSRGASGGHIRPERTTGSVFNNGNPISRVAHRRARRTAPLDDASCLDVHFPTGDRRRRADVFLGPEVARVPSRSPGRRRSVGVRCQRCDARAGLHRQLTVSAAGDSDYPISGPSCCAAGRYAAVTRGTNAGCVGISRVPSYPVGCCLTDKLTAAERRLAGCD